MGAFSGEEEGALATEAARAAEATAAVEAFPIGDADVTVDVHSLQMRRALSKYARRHPIIKIFTKPNAEKMHHVDLRLDVAVNCRPLAPADTRAVTGEPEKYIARAMRLCQKGRKLSVIQCRGTLEARERRLWAEEAFECLEVAMREPCNLDDHPQIKILNRML